MKISYLLNCIVYFLISFTLICCNGIDKENKDEKIDPSVSTEVSIDSENKAYDPEYAKKVGADDYGMRKFVIAFLKRGPNRDRSEEESKALQKGHMDNINRLAEEGKLVLAGPFFGDGDLRGIYVFASESIKEAEEWTKTDPAIQAGSLIMELHEWYGSAAMMDINELHYKAAKIPI